MSRSLVEAIRWCKARAVKMVVVSAALTPTLSMSQYEHEVSDLDKQARSIQDRASEIVGEIGPKGDQWQEAQTAARKLMEQMNRDNPTLRALSEQRTRKSPSAGRSMLIFASLSLGDTGLRELIEAASHDPDALVVLRGIPDGMNLGRAVLSLQEMVADMDPAPNVVLNPVLFRDYAVNSVPTIIQLETVPAPGGTSRVLARVEGISDPRWLSRKIASGARGNLGVRGPVEDIAEQDLIEMAQERASQIDWQEKKDDALANFWERRTFLDLPPATTDRTREIDPSVIITEDIVAEDGKVIVAKGKRINPLTLRPLTSAIVVFNATRSEELESLRADLPPIMDEYGLHQTILIATRMDRGKGWEGYKAITDHFEAPVYLLTPDLVDRFALERTPTIVTARDGKFIVQELAATPSVEAPIDMGGSSE